MSSKKVAVDKMSDYFAMKGKVMNTTEYIRENDGPLSLPAIKRSCGSWSRMLKICERTYPERMAIAKGQKAEEPVKVEKPVVKKAATEAVDKIKTAADALKKIEATNE